ncbi:C-terminal isoform 2 [Hibiscus syriacus]|uniref:C-terminal isoform 2 n=1 Tax=Hibiscus syriacus TaxID=106335 RepID=A0A6A2ZCD5_HIBSY|nr:C-terminal isoform 2 [Hibiscus syriacus]
MLCYPLFCNDVFSPGATLRLAQLDRVAEHLSRNVMEHHEVMVKGMHLVSELEKDLKIANVICRNGRRHLNSSMNEVSRDLVVNTDSKKKQALMHLLPVLAELLHARDMQVALESLVEEGNFCKAFQVLSEYLQLLDSLSELSAIQEMSHGVEVWLGRTLQKLDSLLLGVCQEFKEEGYLTVVDAYSLIGDVSGLSEKIQSFFMQEVISETHAVLKSIVLHEDQDVHMQNSRLTYSDLCLQIPESKFRQCFLRTLAVLFKLMCSYHEIMAFQPENKVLECPITNANLMEESVDQRPGSSSMKESTTATSMSDTSERKDSGAGGLVSEGRNEDGATSSSVSPWYQLRKEAITFVSQNLQRGRKNLWQLMTSRVSVLLSASAAASTSIHQLLKNYEDLNTFILAGEAFCGAEAFEFRQKLKGVCGNYFDAFHRQNVSALKMVLERETWLSLPPETAEIISFAGLVGDGAPLMAASGGRSSNSRVLHIDKSANKVDTDVKKSVFSPWLRNGNPFLLKVSCSYKETHNSSPLNGATSVVFDGNADNIHGDVSPHNDDENNINGSNSISEEENEDLLADFIDEDSQLPSRISKPILSRGYSFHGIDDFTAQTGLSLCVLRSMDKYARLMQKLEIINIEFFKGICQLFELFFHYIFETFGLQNMNSSAKTSTDSLNYRLKEALSRITQDCEEWIKTSSGSFSSTTGHADLTPTAPQNTNFGSPASTSVGLKNRNEAFSNLSAHNNITLTLQERCAGADTIALVARILHRSRTNLQSLLLKSNTTVVEDFFVHLIKQNSKHQLLPIIIVASMRVALPWSGLGGVLKDVSGSILGSFKESAGPGPPTLMELKAILKGLSFFESIRQRFKDHLIIESHSRVAVDWVKNAVLCPHVYVDAVPDLIEHIHRTTARILLHINGYVDRIANAKWELKELGMEHNGYVDLLLGEFKHYKTRLAHGGIQKDVQDLLLDYGLEIVAETLIEGLSRVKRCTDEGRALMSLDLQVLINGLQHFVPLNVKPKLQIVETFIKFSRSLNRLIIFPKPNTYWARAHPEYSKSQIVGLINLVATMKGWKRKTRLEVLEKIE